MVVTPGVGAKVVLDFGHAAAGENVHAVGVNSTSSIEISPVKLEPRIASNTI